jgi:hypothetical protein
MAITKATALRCPERGSASPDESSMRRASSGDSTGVLPHLTTCVGLRTDEAKFASIALADHQPIEQMTDCIANSRCFSGRRRSLAGQLLDVAGDVHRLHRGALDDPRTRPGNRRRSARTRYNYKSWGEEHNEAPAGVGDQGRKGMSRKGNESIHWSSTLQTYVIAQPVTKKQRARAILNDSCVLLGRDRQLVRLRRTWRCLLGLHECFKETTR